MTLLEEVLDRLAGDSRAGNRVLRSSPMSGVQVLDFDCQPSGQVPLLLEPGRFETLLCVGGGPVVSRRGGQSVRVRPLDILLLSSTAGLQSARFSGERFQGILVAVEGRAARDSLKKLCGLLGISLDTRQVGEVMNSHGGCALVRGTAWSDAVFAALERLSPEERAGYCALKAVELLYLLCCRSPLLTRLTPAGYCDPLQAETVRQVHAYMLDHLDEPLTIQSLSQRFHISPTALKSCFRQLYGRPIHQYLLECRMQRAEELLTSTSLPIVQVAGLVGYGSTSQFGAVFRRHSHATPSQFRRYGGKKKV